MRRSRSPPASAPVVADTNIVSYLFKRDSRAAPYRPHLAGRLVVLSFMTLAELDYWAEVHAWGAHRRERLAAFLSR